LQVDAIPVLDDAWTLDAWTLEACTLEACSLDETLDAVLVAPPAPPCPAPPAPPGPTLDELAWVPLVDDARPVELDVWPPWLPLPP
jgi:hypothetical protein